MVNYHRYMKNEIQVNFESGTQNRVLKWEVSHDARRDW